MMGDQSETTELAPLDELEALLPTIAKAKQREHFGSALQKATASAALYEAYPARLDGLATLLEGLGGADPNLEGVIGLHLKAIVATADCLAGTPTLEDLERINQQELGNLPLQVELIEREIEGRWARAVGGTLGGQAVLGVILASIPKVAELGRALSALAKRAERLKDMKLDPAKRVAERDALVEESRLLSDRLLAAGIESEIAQFLLKVAAGPVLLPELTAPILTWIRDHEAAHLFQVSALDA